MQHSSVHNTRKPLTFFMIILFQPLTHLVVCGCKPKAPCHSNSLDVSYSALLIACHTRTSLENGVVS